MRAQTSVQPHQFVAPAPSRVEILGVPLALTDYDEMLEWVDTTVSERQRGYICACNVHTVMRAREDAELMDALLSASLNVPDGQPLVWAINSLGHDLPGRVYGPELMSRSCALAAERGYRVYLYGGRNQGALVQLALNLRHRFPGIRIVGGYSPTHRTLHAEAHAAITGGVKHTGPGLV